MNDPKVYYERRIKRLKQQLETERQRAEKAETRLQIEIDGAMSLQKALEETEAQAAHYRKVIEQALASLNDIVNPTDEDLALVDLLGEALSTPMLEQQNPDHIEEANEMVESQAMPDVVEELAGKVADSWCYEREPLFDDDPQLGRWAAVTTLYRAIGAVLGVSEDEAAEWFAKREAPAKQTEGR